MIVYIGNALSKHGVAPTAADTIPSLLSAEGFEVSVASGFRNQVLRGCHMLLALILNCRRAEAVLIDVYSTRNFWYAYLCSSVCRLLSIPYIPILHGGDFPKRMDSSRGFVDSILAHAYRVVVPSGYLHEELTKRGYSATLIPNAIPVSNYPFRLRDPIFPRLLFVRAFSQIYQPQTALYALKEILKFYPTARLCMVGPDKDGTLGKCRRLAKELGIQQAVTFAGHLDKASWHQLSSEYSLFINTSTKDNMPVSVIEAMALGLPVISTNPGGIRYLIDHGTNGILVNVGDFDAIAMSVREFVENPDLSRSIALKARKKAETFDWSSVKHRWLEILPLHKGLRGL